MTAKQALVCWLATTLALVAGCTTTPATSDPEGPAAATDTTAVTINKSPNDERSYRYLELPNKLKVLLISETGTEKSAAALAVFRGSNHDPDEYLGLAHFLEHMLFIGTEKYPEVDGYQQFLGNHGGSSNAYTASDHTNYFFDVQSEQFDEALDRFAQFFIAPLFDPAYVSREKNAVHSEYQLQLKDDGWRGYSAFKQAFNPAHPGSRFNIGSLQTLGEGVGEAMHKFFAANYSADQMAMVALGAQPLDELEAMIREKFSAIENRNIGDAPPPGPVFTGDGPRELRFKTQKDGYSVDYNFRVPALTDYYDRKPGSYLANLLGHEGAGSLHATLKEKGLIESLAAASSRLDEDNSIVSINLQLTPAGAEQVDAITASLFQYIELINRNGIEAWRFDEQARVGELAFRFAEKRSPTATVYTLAPVLRYTPPEDLLTAPFLFERYDEALLERYAGLLTPENLVIQFGGPDLETDKAERFFGVQYALGQVEIQRAEPCIQCLALPSENPFLPDDLSVLDVQPQAPETATEADGLALWLATDTEFGTPRANQFFRIAIPGGLATPRDHVLATLYSQLVADALNEWAYPAQLAGLAYRINQDPAGFSLSLGGYNQKQPELLAEVLKAFRGLTVDAERFELYKARLAKQLRNFDKERPYTQVAARSTQSLRSRNWPERELADALAPLTVADVTGFRDSKLKQVAVKGLLHGNLSEEDAKRTRKTLQEHLSLATVPFEESEPRELTQQERLRLNVDHNDAAIAIYVQMSGTDYGARARTALLAETIRQNFFTELRTNQQLGYVVAARNRPQRQQPGMIFLIQSPVAGAPDLEKAISTFLSDQRAALQALSDEALDGFKAGLITKLTEKEKNLNQRSFRYWNDISLGDFSFRSQENIAEAVAALTREDLMASYQELVEHFEGERLVVYTPGKFDGEAVSVGD